MNLGHMTDKQAYAAMFRFLEGVYERTKSNDIGGLLGSLSLLPDGSPADPAFIEDWREAVQFALAGGDAATLTLAR
jgi:hypothetical protein